MRNPKKHHYNPRRILRHFSADAEHIWSYSKAEGMVCRKIERVSVVKHLYKGKTIDTTNKASQSSNPKTFEQGIRKGYSYERSISQLVDCNVHSCTDVS